MKYLQVLDTIRSITGARGVNYFPKKNAALETIGNVGQGDGVAFVYDPVLTRDILSAKEYKQEDFLHSSLRIMGNEEIKWIRQFYAESPLFADGKIHSQRRKSLETGLALCSLAIGEMTQNTLEEAIEAELTKTGATSLKLASVLTISLINQCLSTLTGRKVSLSPEMLLDIDFFNPFPKPSTLARCDRAIGTCMLQLNWQQLDSPQRHVASALLIMGASPMIATVTASINALLQTFSNGGTVSCAQIACRKVTFQRTVPTNFVMRRCVEETTLAGVRLAPGDRLYVFLAAANGCPFRPGQSWPFGSGKHVCSGQSLATQMLQLAQASLTQKAAAMAASPLPRISPVKQGSASAFLTFADSTK